MEQVLNKKFEDYIIEFKENIKRKLFSVPGLDPHNANEIMEYIYDYERLKFSKEDLKQKKMKSEINTTDTCIAILLNGNQCNRKKKKNMDYCGGHCNFQSLQSGEFTNLSTRRSDKSNVHREGVAVLSSNPPTCNDENISTLDPSLQNDLLRISEADVSRPFPNSVNEDEDLLKIDIFTENICGILYYIDKYNNVYNTEDIMNNIKNPRIIAKYNPSEIDDNSIDLPERTTSKDKKTASSRGKIENIDKILHFPP